MGIRPASTAFRLQARLCYGGNGFPPRCDCLATRFWLTNPAIREWLKREGTCLLKFVREHQCPSFLEYGEYPYVSADEIKKARC